MAVAAENPSICRGIVLLNSAGRALTPAEYSMEEARFGGRTVAEVSPHSSFHCVSVLVVHLAVQLCFCFRVFSHQGDTALVLSCLEPLKCVMLGRAACIPGWFHAASHIYLCSFRPVFPSHMIFC